MKEIRTPNGRLYGTLNEKTYDLHIKDGKNVRIIPVPQMGWTFQYIAGDSPPEKVYIPPMAVKPTAA